ncbi:MAG: reverse transcriptase domain-containing protein [Oscillospiraceae bacterium]|nr:reverse transcriptase domain-containing protein [Oscillospiraceae bacterium]
MKPTTEILERIYSNSQEHNDGVYTRLYRYLLREDTYYLAYQKLYANKGAATRGTDNDTADGFGKKYVDRLIKELTDGTYQPKPVRREYIKKQNGKMRPLGIPSFRDKLLQEVMRRFLEAIYEPTFSDFSHGFRPGRSCHTALTQAKHYFVGARWFIEGDIKGCFDNIDHGKLIEILERKIKDSRFINLIRAFLKGGYIEDWEYNKTFCGTPQGGILSPMLANIYLNELDKKVMELKQAFDKPAERTYTKEYALIVSRINHTREYLKTAEGERREMLLEKLKMLRKQQLQVPSKDQTDKNIAYIRYADDFVISVNGDKTDCQRIKAELAKFLHDEYHLTLSEEKTLITHSSDRVRFLGYDLSVRRNQEVRKNAIGVKSRHLNGTVELLVPMEKIEQFLFDRGIIRQTKAKTFRPVHRKSWLYLPDVDILDRYNAEIRGILNYYHFAANFYNLDYFCYLMEYSCLATLASKYDSSISKIIDKHKCGKDWVIRYKRKDGSSGERRIVKLRDCREIPKVCSNIIPVHRRHKDTPNSTIWSRLRAGVCELCAATDKGSYEVHHISSLKALAGTKPWELAMIKKRRKTLVVCEDCHDVIHEM